MNILVVSGYGLYGNLSSSFVHNQAKAYAALGHRVRSLILLPMGKQNSGSRFFPPVQIVRQDGVELCYLRFVSMSNFGASWFNTPSALTALKINLTRVVDGFFPDVIHSNAFGHASEAGAWLKEKLGRPLVITTHGGDTSYLVMQGKASQLKPIADQADHIAAVSSALASKLRTCGTKTPISVILNGFSIEHTVDRKPRTPCSLIQVCHLQEQKRISVTVCAFARIKRDYPEASLTIIGQGPQRKELETLCHTLGVENATHFYGEISNIQVMKAMAQHRFFVMPSVNEGFGIVYLEAMASGCITIGTEGEGIADLIVNGVNGFLVPPDNPEAIADVVEWCIQHPEQAAAIAQRGCRNARELTWKHNAEQYIKLFEEMT